MSYAGPVSRGKRAPEKSPTRFAAAPRPTGAFTAGILLGVIVGAGAALLLAPRSGVATRRAMARRRRRLARQGHDAWDDLRLEFRRALEHRRAASRKHMAIDDDPEVIVVE